MKAGGMARETVKEGEWQACVTGGGRVGDNRGHPTGPKIKPGTQHDHGRVWVNNV